MIFTRVFPKSYETKTNVPDTTMRVLFTVRKRGEKSEYVQLLHATASVEKAFDDRSRSFIVMNAVAELHICPPPVKRVPFGLEAISLYAR